MITSFKVEREEVEGERTVFSIAVMLNLSFERRVDGEKCILG